MFKHLNLWEPLKIQTPRPFCSAKRIWPIFQRSHNLSSPNKSIFCDFGNLSMSSHKREGHRMHFCLSIPCCTHSKGMEGQQGKTQPEQHKVSRKDRKPCSSHLAQGGSQKCPQRPSRFAQPHPAAPPLPHIRPLPGRLLNASPWHLQLPRVLL